jgi:hypothetical protein
MPSFCSFQKYDAEMPDLSFMLSVAQIVSNGESEKKNKNPLSDVYALFRAALPFHSIQCSALPCPAHVLFLLFISN